jgi:hypothetical protein
MGDYSEAIPIGQPVKMAAVDIDVCNPHSESVIRQRAEKVVGSELCPGASPVESIVDAVVEEYFRQPGSVNSDGAMKTPQASLIASDIYRA